MLGTSFRKPILVVAALICGALPASGQMRYDRKLERAAMAVVAKKMGPMRGSLDQEWRAAAPQRAISKLMPPTRESPSVVTDPASTFQVISPSIMQFSLRAETIPAPLVKSQLRIVPLP